MSLGISKHSLVVLVAFAVVVSACSGGASPSGNEGTSATEPSTPATPTSISAAPASSNTSTPASTVAEGDVTVAACDLLTQEEVAAAIGDATQDPVFDDTGDGFFTCSYEGESGDMMVDVFVYPDIETAKGAFAAGIDMGGNERIEGPGDEAMSTQPLGDISVRLGRMEFSIDLFTYAKSEEEELTIAKELAATVVAQLG